MKKDQLFEKIKQGHPRGSYKICVMCDEVLNEGMNYCSMCHSHRLLKLTIL